jgi:predicted RNase H-like HicB family nuclease
MKHNIKAYIYRGEKYYIAECQEISVITQGKTLDETIANLQEAVNLHLEGENLPIIKFMSPDNSKITPIPAFPRRGGRSSSSILPLSCATR